LKTWLNWILRFTPTGGLYRLSAIIIAPFLTGLCSISEIVEFKSLASAEKFIISLDRASSKKGRATKIS
jgi:hypothetical protein